MCQWICLTSLTEENQRICGDEVKPNSRYCPRHDSEMAAFMAQGAEEAFSAVNVELRCDSVRKEN